jgi:hypothetical protein
MVDHVHPGIEGHQLLAAALTEMLIAQLALPPEPGWEEVRKEWYRQHFESIPPVYFSHGTERLSALRNWAAGRAVRLRPEPHDSGGGASSPDVEEPQDQPPRTQRDAEEIKEIKESKESRESRG